MEKQKYELKLDGLPEAKGEIKAIDLQRVISALLKVAERVTRLYVFGDGKGDSSYKPAWLRASLDVTVKGLREGSTILELDAPCVHDVASEQFSQEEFWRDAPAEDDSSLDLAAYAVQEILSEDPAGDRYDVSVIDAVMDFRKVAEFENVTMIFQPKGKGKSGRFKLHKANFDRIKARKDQIPQERAFIVSGKLDMITHTTGRFNLQMLNGEELAGRIHSEFLDQEQLKPLWGEEVTVEGMVYFKANGTPRMIQARKLNRKQEGDDIFAKLPTSTRAVEQDELFPELAKKASAFDPMALWGLWKGDEPVEDLLELLD